MGFSPREVDRMTLWQFMAAFEGYQIAHGQKRKSGDLSEDQLSAMGVEGF